MPWYKSQKPKLFFFALSDCPMVLSRELAQILSDINIFQHRALYELIDCSISSERLDFKYVL